MSVSETTATADRKLDIGHTVAEAYRLLFGNLLTFCKIAAFPLLLWILMPLVWPLIYDSSKPTLGGLVGFETMVLLENLGVPSLIADLLTVIAVLMFVSHWMQFAMTSAGNRPGRIVWFWSSRDRRLFLFILLFSLKPLMLFLFWRLDDVWLFVTPDTYWIGEIAMSLMLPSIWAEFAVIAIIEAFVIGRSAPAFAAAADGVRMGLARAWHLTRGQTLRVMALWLMLFWFTFVITGLLQFQINLAYFEYATSGLGRFFGDSPLSGPFIQSIVQLPRAIGYFAALALGASLFVQVYRGNRATRGDSSEDLLERFD